LSKKFNSRSCLKFRGGNDDRNGIFSSHTEVISDVILLVHLLRGALAKKCGGVTRNSTICAKNSTFGYIDMEPFFLAKIHSYLQSLITISLKAINSNRPSHPSHPDIRLNIAIPVISFNPVVQLADSTHSSRTKKINQVTSLTLVIPIILDIPLIENIPAFLVIPIIPVTPVILASHPSYSRHPGRIGHPGPSPHRSC